MLHTTRRTLDEGERPVGDVDELLLDDDAQSRKHSHTAVSKL